MQGFGLDLKNIFILFQQNFKEVTLFILFCAVFNMIATSQLKNALIELMMKVSGTTYIVPINLQQVFLHPGSILLILFFSVIITFLALFEIAGLLHAFSMGQVGRETNLTSMFLAGLRTCRNALHPRNWLIVAFIMILFPLTKVLPLSSSTFKLILPGFVNQTIAYTAHLRILYSLVYLGLLCVTVVYIFSINIFVLQRTSFMKSCSRSRQLGKGHYLHTFLAESVDKPYVCAHRGDNVNAPENTMPAFELAASENLSWIELDVHQTSDGVIVCNHDSSIGRVTGQDLAVHDHTYAELTSYEMGDWMPGNYEHVVIPTLTEALTMAREKGLYVQVELKGHPDDVDFEENVLKVINDTGMHDNVMVIAQDANRIMRIKELDPTVLKAYCMFIALGRIEDIDYTDNVSIEETNVTPELVRRLHSEGKKVFCWTVDLEDTLQYLVSCDIDVIGTDNPTMVSAALDKVDYSGGLPRAFHILLNTIANMEK